MSKPGKKVLSLFLSVFMVIPLLAFSGMQASAAEVPPAGVSSEESMLTSKKPPEPQLTKRAALVTGTTNIWEITVTVAGRYGYVTDPIGQQFDLASPVYSDIVWYWDNYYWLGARYDSNAKTLIWGVGSDSLSDVVTFKYRVTVKDTANLGDAYPTNGVTTFHYGRDESKNFDVPTVTLPHGSIQVKGYLVDKDGNPIDEDGNAVAEPEDAQIIYDAPFIPEGSESGALDTGTFTVGAPSIEHFALYGETNSADILVNPSSPEGMAWFPYEKLYAYTIAYYKDANTEPEATSDALYAKLDSVITFNGTAPEGVDLDGYKLDGDNTKSLTITEEGNILKVYYVKDTFGYTVEYYKNGEKFDTYENTALFKSTINDYPDRAPIGYVRSDITGKPLTITSDPKNNVIKVYYVPATYGYAVNYFKDGSGTPFAQSSLNAKFGDVISSYENKAPTGYVLDTASGLPLTIGVDESKNVINVSYKKGQFAYKIEYYKEGSDTPFDTASGKGIFGDVISAYGDKAPSGYTFSRVVGGPLTISENEANNVIKVYYKLVPVTPTTGENSSKTLLPMLFACGSLCGGLVIKKESLRKKAKD